MGRIRKIPGKHFRQRGEVAVDHIIVFAKTGVMEEMGLRAYRFSVSWPGPAEGAWTTNEKGLGFTRPDRSLLALD